MPGSPYLPNYRAMNARAGGGMLGRAYGMMGASQRPMNTAVGAAPQQAPIFSSPQSQPFSPNPSNYGAGSVTFGKPGEKRQKISQRYKPENIMRSQYDALKGRQNYQAGREVAANTAYDTALGDPRAQAGMFQQIYADSANALASPILRQFQTSLSNSRGANASRFGGATGSTEGARGEFNTSDVFSRNLAEMIQSQGGQAVNAGMDFTNMLGQRARDANGAMDSNTALAMQAGQGAKKQGGGLGSTIGGVLGAGIGSLAGNPGFGAAMGSRIFGK